MAISTDRFPVLWAGHLHSQGHHCLTEGTRALLLDSLVTEEDTETRRLRGYPHAVAQRLNVMARYGHFAGMEAKRMGSVVRL